MKYRVFDNRTKEEVTHKYSSEWVITPDGKLYINDYGDLVTEPDVIAVPEKEVGEFLRSK